MEKIVAPFTDEQVKNLNEYQKSTGIHPFTCCSHEGCNRTSQPNEGILIARTQGWVCPCGKYKQNWAHKFMADKIEAVSKELIIEIIFALGPLRGDLSDIGNEIGIVVAKTIHGKNIPGFEKEDFINGFNHGYSLIDGSHDKPTNEEKNDN